jgi:hypothetical protein
MMIKLKRKLVILWKSEQVNGIIKEHQNFIIIRI